jgi:hypothetical protein
MFPSQPKAAQRATRLRRFHIGQRVPATLNSITSVNDNSSAWQIARRVPNIGRRRSANLAHGRALLERPHDGESGAQPRPEHNQSEDDANAPNDHRLRLHDPCLELEGPIAELCSCQQCAAD